MRATSCAGPLPGPASASQVSRVSRASTTRPVAGSITRRVATDTRAGSAPASAPGRVPPATVSIAIVPCAEACRVSRPSRTTRAPPRPRASTVTARAPSAAIGPAISGGDERREHRPPPIVGQFSQRRDEGPQPRAPRRVLPGHGFDPAAQRFPDRGFVVDGDDVTRAVELEADGAPLQPRHPGDEHAARPGVLTDPDQSDVCRIAGRRRAKDDRSFRLKPPLDRALVALFDQDVAKRPTVRRRESRPVGRSDEGDRDQQRERVTRGQGVFPVHAPRRRRRRA